MRHGAGCRDDKAFETAKIDFGEARHKIGVNQQNPRRRVGKHMLEQAAPISGVERHEDGAEVVDRIKGQKRVGSIWQPHRHMIALLDAERAQASGLGANAGVDVGKAPFGPVRKDDMRLVGPLGRPAVEQVAQHAFVAIGNARILKVSLARRPA